MRKIDLILDWVSLPLPVVVGRQRVGVVWGDARHGGGKGAGPVVGQIHGCADVRDISTEHDHHNKERMEGIE